MSQKVKYKSLQDFYSFYLIEHQNTANRVLHFIGTTLVVLIVFGAILFHLWLALLAIPFIGYGFAWFGHFFFEKNKPATFQYPLFSLASDFMLFWDILQGKQSFKAK
jgi:hypothetical protein